ncbi:hypothetical protein ACK4QF_21240 [Proteus mirabilis]|uniref:Uncharacterized protein n=1 Tax=Proteus mirabilis TaxID=584 RepID=A0A7D5W6D6_PROMI|nr:hypothetical protein HZ283_15060 [Proteus mirabilis]HDA9904572.1 hypothetical protein [Proteus mirabilis]HEH4198478.1 hypothetical protein [Proteus mirabilis]HEH4213013.1 hypothetical protein [Proteus mirabilis]HEH4264552.1 hypothetical protein [Proteus mirabilis]
MNIDELIILPNLSELPEGELGKLRANLDLSIDSLITGMKIFGDFMFWADANESYPDGKDHLGDVGLFLSQVSLLISILNDKLGGVEYEISNRKIKGTRE